MAAAAFTETFIFKGRSTGEVIHIPATVSDVAAAYAIFPDGNSFLQLPSGQAWDLIDVIVVTGGTDTNFQDLYVNQRNTGIKISNKSNLNNSNFRQFYTAPLGFKPGSMLRLIQTA